jgi:hypothetical protein
VDDGVGGWCGNFVDVGFFEYVVILVGGGFWYVGVGYYVVVDVLGLVLYVFGVVFF